MKFLQILQEASDSSISELKKAVQKDKRVSLVLKKDSSFDQIADVSAFLATIKFIVLNNKNVRDFVVSRENVKDLYKREFDLLRRKKADEFNAEDFAWLKHFIQLLFKEIQYVGTGSLSRETRKELDAFVNGNSRYHTLSQSAMRELESVPGIRPNKKTVLYRGLLFPEYSLKERTRYDGTLDRGAGLKFLDAVREGTRTVDLDWDRASSWTTDKEVADNFAKYGPASSSYSATLQWLTRSAKKKAIDGELGFVISTLADPADILIDVSKYKPTTHHAHGDESEMIMRPGKYLCRIHKKYTVEGEVDPDKRGDDALKGVINKAVENLESINIPSALAELGVDDKYVSSGIDLLKDRDTFKKLLLNSTTEAAHKAFDNIVKFYKENLKGLQKSDLTPDLFIGNEKSAKAASAIKSIYDIMEMSVRHSSFERGSGNLHDLSAEQYRTTMSSEFSMAVKDFNVWKKVTKKSNHLFYRLANILGIPSDRNLHLLGAAKQHPKIDELISAFFKYLNVDKPEDRAEALALMDTILKKVMRNYKIISLVNQVNSHIEKLK